MTRLRSDETPLQALVGFAGTPGETEERRVGCAGRRPRGRGGEHRGGGAGAQTPSSSGPLPREDILGVTARGSSNLNPQLEHGERAFSGFRDFGFFLCCSVAVLRSSHGEERPCTPAHTRRRVQNTHYAHSREHNTRIHTPLGTRRRKHTTARKRQQVFDAPLETLSTTHLPAALVGGVAVDRT